MTTKYLYLYLYLRPKYLYLYLRPKYLYLYLYLNSGYLYLSLYLTVVVLATSLLTHHLQFFDIQALWRSVLSARVLECQKILNGGLDQYGPEHFEV